MSYVFISYSRQQFYFAESLTTNLEKRHIPTWLDVKNILLGEDWETSIHRGIEHCTAFILVVSKAALESQNVRDELNLALQLQKPIFVAYYETIVLPAELRNCAIIDFRGQFNPALTRLANLLERKALSSDRVPQRGTLLGVPTRLSFGIAFVCLVLVLEGLWCWSSSLYFPAAFKHGYPGLALLWVGFGMWLWSEAWRLLHRRIQFFRVYFTLIYGLIAPCAPYLMAYATKRIPIHLLVSFPFHNLASYLIALVTPLLGLAAIFVLYLSPDILRWLPIGEAPGALRLWCYQRRLFGPKRTKAKALTAATYHLHFTDGDETIAEQVRFILGRFGHTEVAADAAQYQMVIISNYLSRKTLDELTKYNRLISIIATPVQIPKSLSRVSSYQLVDYRTRSRAVLENLALTLGSVTVPTVLPGNAVVPENLSRPVLPPELEVVTLSLRYNGLVFISVALINLIGVMSGRIPFDGPEQLRRPFALQMLFFLFGLLILWLSAGVTHRRITYPLLVVSVWISLVVAVQIAHELYNHFDVSWVFSVVVLCLPILAEFQSLNKWLPRYAKHVKPKDTYGSSNLLRYWYINLLLFILICLVNIPWVLELNTMPIR